MKKIVVLLFVFILIGHGAVYADSSDTPPAFEKMYLEWGYTSVDKALSEFEQHFEKDVKLPLRIPHLAFTHQFGKFNDMEDDINDSFEINFVNDQQPENHYKIDVRPVKNRIPFTKRHVEGTYKLKDGTVASYVMLSPGQVQFYGLVFEKDNWQYILSIHKRVADTVNLYDLIDIANSFEG